MSFKNSYWWRCTNAKRQVKASGLYASVEINQNALLEWWIIVTAYFSQRLFPKHHTLNQDIGIQNPFLTKNAENMFIIRRPINETIRDTNERENMALHSSFINKYTKHKLTIIRCQSQRLIWRRSESYNVLLSYNENKN